MGRLKQVGVGSWVKLHTYFACPRAEATDGDTTAMVKVIFRYRNMATKADMSVTDEDTMVKRPEHASEWSAEVEPRRARVKAA